MPWTIDDAAEHTRKATTPRLKRLWAAIANKVLSATNDEARAIREANAAVARRGSIGRVISVAASVLFALFGTAQAQHVQPPSPSWPYQVNPSNGTYTFPGALVIPGPLTVNGGCTGCGNFNLPFTFTNTTNISSGTTAFTIAPLYTGTTATTFEQHNFPSLNSSDIYAAYQHGATVTMDLYPFGFFLGGCTTPLGSGSTFGNVMLTCDSTNGATLTGRGTSEDVVLKTWNSTIALGIDDGTATTHFFGHLKATGGTPTLSACGTSPTLVANSTDTKGTINLGTGSITNCTLTFQTAYVTAPVVVSTLVGDAAAWSGVSSVSTTQVTFDFNTSVGSPTQLNYIVVQ